MSAFLMGYSNSHRMKKASARSSAAKARPKSPASTTAEVATAEVAATELWGDDALWRDLFTFNTAGVLAFDCSFQIVDANPAMCKLLKYERKALVKLEIGDVIAPGHGAKFEKMFSSLKKGCEAPPSFETRLQRSDHKEVEVIASVTCRCALERKKHHCFMIFNDVSVRKTAEDALQRELQLNRVLIDHAPIAIGLMGPDGRLLRVNREAENLFGFLEKEVIGRTVWEFPVLTDEEATASKKRFQMLLQGADQVSATIPMRTRDGALCYVASETTAVRRQDGQIDYLVTTGKDVTENKRLEAEVIRVAEQEHMRIGADLHDGVGQTLTGIAALTEVLIQSLTGQERQDAERIHELLKTSQEEVRRLSHGLSPAAVKNRDLSGGLRLIADTIRLNFRRECECHLDESIKVLNPEAVTHLFRIAQEAVNNALRHGGAQKIRISLRRHDKASCVLEVGDDGSGFQVNKKKGINDGSGIGIRVMEYRANLLGGQLKVHAQPGKGVRVSCYFPAALLKDRKLTIL